MTKKNAPGKVEKGKTNHSGNTVENVGDGRTGSLENYQGRKLLWGACEPAKGFQRGNLGKSMAIERNLV